MCGLCDTSPDERAHAVAEHREIAIALEKLAQDYRRMARGELQPHDPEAMRETSNTARTLIVHLVNEWV